MFDDYYVGKNQTPVFFRFYFFHCFFSFYPKNQKISKCSDFKIWKFWILKFHFLNFFLELIFFSGYSFDVEFSKPSISDVFTAIWALQQWQIMHLGTAYQLISMSCYSLTPPPRTCAMRVSERFEHSKYVFRYTNLKMLRGKSDLI